MDQDQSVFESTINSLRGMASGAGILGINDATVRLNYAKEIDNMSRNLRNEVAAGRMTWKQAAQHANETRNIIMDIARKGTSPIGRSFAQNMKPNGIDLSHLLDRKATQMYGTGFNALSNPAKNAVYESVVVSAGKSNPVVNAKIGTVSKFCRGLIVISLAVSVYNVALAEDKVDAGAKEVAMLGGGFLASVGGGAAAGLVCGPGAPVCVTVGAFVGGVIAVFSIDYFW